jgi:hypothetical protein
MHHWSATDDVMATLLDYWKLGGTKEDAQVRMDKDLQDEKDKKINRKKRSRGELTVVSPLVLTEPKASYRKPPLNKGKKYRRNHKRTCKSNQYEN